jgi:mycofactocin precursor
MECPMAEAGTIAATVDTEEIETDQLIEDEVLVEEVSIDGMCGVY